MWGAGRRVMPGGLGRLCVSPVPFFSLQLEHDRSRAEEYVFQILPYLQHAQVTVRTAALRFIGEPHSLGSLL